MPATRTIGSFIERSWIPSIAIALAVMAWVIYVGEGIDAYYRTRLVDMVHGTAYRPYVYRVLVPGLARLGTALTPPPVAHLLTTAFDRWPARPSGWVAASATDYVFVVLIMTASLVGFAAGVRALSRSVFTADPIVHALISLAAIASLPLTFGPFSRQIYDFTTLCLVTWCLALMVQARWRAFAIVFFLACLNKESSLLLILVYAVHVATSRTGLSRGVRAGLLVYQVLAFIAVRVSVVYAFRDNPGDTVEVHLFDHNQQVLLHPADLSRRLVLLIAVAIAGTWGWKDKPLFLRQAFVVLGVTLVLMGVTVGMVDEIRAYYEIYSVVVLMAAHTLCRALGLRVEPAPPRVAATAGAHA